MPLTVHTITAVAVDLSFGGGPFDFDLGVIDATVTMDDSWSPFVQAEMTIPTYIEDILDLIDPRSNVRVHLVLTRVEDNGTYTRTFDLLLRERSADHNTETTRLLLESDEGLLIDKGKVATTTDSTALAYQSSLRTLINHMVLAGIGTALATDAGADADLTVYSDSENMLPNPSAETNLTGWTATGCTFTRLATSFGLGAYCFRLASSTSSNSRIISDPINVSEGETYAFSGDMRVIGALSGATGASSRSIAIYNVDQSVRLGVSNAGTTVPGNDFMRVSGEVTIPRGVSQIRVLLYHGHNGTGTVDWDAVKLAPKLGVRDEDYFDGATPNTSKYTYTWTGTAHASESIRTNASGTDRSVDMFQWAPGVTAWDFLEPLVQTAGLRLYCDEARIWHLVDPAVPVQGQINITEGANVTVARDTISRYREWFDSVVIKYSWLDRRGESRVKYDAAGAPGTKTLTLEHDRPFPGRGAAAALLKRSGGRGRVLDLSAISDYKATPGKAVRATLPNSPVQTGYIGAVTWDFPDAQMSITTRQLIDTPANAWYYLASGIKWTDSAAGQTWLAEPI